MGSAVMHLEVSYAYEDGQRTMTHENTERLHSFEKESVRKKCAAEQQILTLIKEKE